PNSELATTATSATHAPTQGSPYATRRTAPVNVTGTIGELPEVWYWYRDSNPVTWPESGEPAGGRDCCSGRTSRSAAVVKAPCGVVPSKGVTTVAVVSAHLVSCYSSLSRPVAYLCNRLEISV